MLGLEREDGFVNLTGGSEFPARFRLSTCTNCLLVVDGQQRRFRDAFVVFQFVVGESVFLGHVSRGVA